MHYPHGEMLIYCVCFVVYIRTKMVITWNAINATRQAAMMNVLRRRSRTSLSAFGSWRYVIPMKTMRTSPITPTAKINE